MASSRLIWRGGVSRISISLFEERMLVRCFFLHTLTARSPGRWCLADHHAFVDLHARPQEQVAALLGVLQAISWWSCPAPRPPASRCARRRSGRPWAIAIVEDGVHHAHAARGGQELVAEAQQAARGHQVA